MPYFGAAAIWQFIVLKTARMLSSRAAESGHVSKREKHTLIAGNSGQMNRSVLSNADTFKYLSSTFKRHKNSTFCQTYSQKTLQMLNPIYTFYHRYSCTDFLMYRNLQFETKFSLCQMYFKNRTNFTFPREDLKFLTLISHTSRYMGWTGWWYSTLESHARFTKKTLQMLNPISTFYHKYSWSDSLYFELT